MNRKNSLLRKKVEKHKKRELRNLLVKTQFKNHNDNTILPSKRLILGNPVYCIENA